MKARSLLYKLIYYNYLILIIFEDIFEDMSTMHRMMNWFIDEPWIERMPAFKNMQIVRKMHMIMKTKLFQHNNNEIDKSCKSWCSDRELLLKDFAEACPFKKIGQHPYKSFMNHLKGNI